ncbi:sigma-70 family RNA polymerase sigma factor [Brevundimonas sp.]|uniref:sigma-70 family RNA polymerase sigma factor n=1 Tax=Brevundimonas sp. TaxID=1871086 RepID=UPI0027318AD3|nr:sigma-70 family RNA polymerase sigma factor [Brevundimonas sp.]MDP1912241.1 sigma-70 family RNA polymerase sigma factor [Brevundimonas sp.]
MTFESELAALRTPLLRFAKMQLRNDSLAEDLVSETLLALLEKPDAFEGRSSLRTYATGILKFKIIDLLRRQGREIAIEVQADESVDDAIDALFVADGHYREPQPAWQQPERALEQSQFFAALQACIEGLPPRLARLFMMREWLEQDMADVCTELGITANHAGVMLYRARMQLRACLNQGWFEGQR